MRRQDDAEAVSARPLSGFAGAFVNLGNLHRDRMICARGSCYRRALTLAPHTAAHCGLGLTLWQLGRNDEAIASCRAALGVDPDHPETLVNLGLARAEDGALEEAEPLHARALTVWDPDILNHLASVRRARGIAGALEAIRRSLAVQETPRARKLFVELARRFDWAAARPKYAASCARPHRTVGQAGALSHAAARLIDPSRNRPPGDAADRHGQAPAFAGAIAETRVSRRSQTMRFWSRASDLGAQHRHSAGTLSDHAAAP
jgi:tetratricopeptide (TPR) repeat protein